MQFSMSSTWLYWLIGGFGAGVLWHSFFDVSFFLVLLCIVVGVALLMVGAFFTQEKRLPFLIALAFFALAGGSMRYDRTITPSPPAMEQAVGSSPTLLGTVIDEPDERDTHIGLLLAVTEVNGASTSARVVVNAPLSSRYAYGEVLQVKGKLQKPGVIQSDDGRDFDYAAYLAKDDIRYTVSFPTIELVSHNGGNVVLRTLFSLKHIFLDAVARVVPEPEASLLGGLVVGAKQSLGEALLAEFRVAGVIHIVVLSGYNISIIAETIMRTLSFLPEQVGLGLGSIGIILFSLLVGAGPSVVRASIMALIVLLARATGRTYDMTRALFLAAFLMVVHNPRILVWDMSFQLSFLATLGLIVVSPIIERVLHRVPTKLQMREIMVATLSTQVFVLPFILYKMGTLSVIALVANLIILPLVPFTMLIGFFTGVAALVSTAVALPLAFITTLLLRAELLVVHLCASVPFAQISVPVFPWWVALLLYAVIGFALFHLSKTARGEASGNDTRGTGKKTTS